MPIITPADLIAFSLKAVGVLGVGQTALSEDFSDCFSALNSMMALWNRRRWLVYHLIDVSALSTGAQAYSVGPGGDFNVPRPDRLEAAYFRQYFGGSPGTNPITGAPTLLVDGVGGPLLLDGPGGGLLLDGGSSIYSAALAVGGTPAFLQIDGLGGPLLLDGVGGQILLDGYGTAPTPGPTPVVQAPYSVDYPLELLEAREDYSDIALKALQSWPSCIWYDSAWPLGFVYPWPIPQASLYELHLVIKDTLSGFTSLRQTINLPPEYVEPLWTNLAVRLAPLYQVQVRPEVMGLAKGGLETIRGNYTQVPRLGMPRGLGRSQGRYNVFSDQIY